MRGGIFYDVTKDPIGFIGRSGSKIQTIRVDSGRRGRKGDSPQSFDLYFSPVFVELAKKSSMAEDNAMDNRIDKLFNLIAKCKFGIHDISCTELDPGNHLPRFNMPFELGVFYGARRYGSKEQKNKNALIFERQRYLYQQYLSDINGVDIKAHNNDPNMIIKHIRNWLRTASRRTTIPGEQRIINHYSDFLKQLPIAANDAGFASIDAIPFNDYCQMVEEALLAGGLT